MTAASPTSPRTSRIAIALLLAAVALTAVILVARSGTPRPPERVPSTIATVKSATADTIRAPSNRIPAALQPPANKKMPATSSTSTSTQSAGAGTSAGADTSTVPNVGTGGSGSGATSGTGGSAGSGGSGGSGNSGCSELGPC